METILMLDVVTDCMFLANKPELEKHRALIKSMLAAKTAYGKYKESVIRKFASNNWLKLHGYPMRRRVR